MSAAVAVGRNVKMLRKAQKLSQSDLADRMGWSDIQIHQVTIARLEGGKRPTSVDELVALAMIHGVTPASLLEPGLSVDELQSHVSDDKLLRRITTLESDNARLRAHLRGIAETAAAASSNGGAS